MMSRAFVLITNTLPVNMNMQPLGYILKRKRKSAHFTCRFSENSRMEYYHAWNHFLVITKTYLYNFEPLKPHIYIVKLGFTGVYTIFITSV